MVWIIRCVDFIICLEIVTVISGIYYLFLNDFSNQNIFNIIVCFEIDLHSTPYNKINHSKLFF